MIEVEVRSFIDEEQYNMLIERFRNESDTHEEDEQITYYFTGPDDLRIQKNSTGAKLWLKKGELHDDAREELEVRIDENDFDELEELLAALGYDVEIKWFRTRNRFHVDGIKTTVDHTEGYGRIIELEKLVDDDEDVYDAKKLLEEKMAELGVELTPKERFQERYEWYRNNWQDAVN